MSNAFHIHADIIKTMEAIQFLSAHEYTLLEQYRNIENINIIDPNSQFNANDTTSTKMLQVLTTDIYNQLYNKNPEDNDVQGENIDQFILALSNANNGTGTWENDWLLLEETSNSQCIVQKNNVHFWVDDNDTSIIKNGAMGSSCKVRVGKELRNLNSHFYMALGNKAAHELPLQDKIVRFYWNLNPLGAIEYMKQITTALNSKNIYFKTKVIAKQDNYTRSDAGVLYIDKTQLEEAMPEILKTYDVVKPYLKNNVPLYTRQLNPGLSFAENPLGNQSFGIHRSQLIAASLIQSNNNGLRALPLVIDNMRTNFETNNIDIYSPYCTISNLSYYESVFNKYIYSWN